MSAAVERNNNKVILQSSDGEMFEIDKSVALMSNFLKTSIECEGTVTTIGVPNVSGNILKMVKDYCEYHHSEDAAATVDTVKTWNAEFVKPLVENPPTLFALTMAAHYLDIHSLLDLTCQTIVGMIKGKTLEEIRQIFNIENDLSPEEEAKIRQEHQWGIGHN